MKVGWVAIVGVPNVGKSTLLNKLLHERLAIITPKPQTTRHRILGILTGEDYQIIFIDTPGIINPAHELHRAMMRAVDVALKDADLVYWMIDVEQREVDENLVRKLKDGGKTVFLVINKVDKIWKPKLLPWIDEYSKLPFDEIIPISAMKDKGLDDLLETTLKYLPEGEPFFPPDQVSDRPERFFVQELIREKIYKLYGEEIPYAASVEIEEMRNGKKTYIKATIWVEKDSQKKIIIGKNGEKIKKLGRYAREEIEGFLQRPVYLELWVKTKKNWRKNPYEVKRMGYG